MREDNSNSKPSKLELTILKENSFKVPENYFNSVEDTVFEKLTSEILPLKTLNQEFKIPADYFNTIEEGVLAELKIRNLLKEDVKSGFETPPNYLDSLENKINLQLQLSDKKTDKNQNKKTVKVISLRKRMLNYFVPIAAAASIVLVFSLQFKTQKVTFDSLANSEIDNLIDNGAIDIDAYKVALLDPEIKFDITNNLSNDEMENYLDRQDLDNLVTDN